MMNIMKMWTKRFKPYEDGARKRDVKLKEGRVKLNDTRRRYIQFRYTDTGEIATIDMSDPDTFDRMFSNGRPIEVMCFNRSIK